VLEIIIEKFKATGFQTKTHCLTKKIRQLFRCEFCVFWTIKKIKNFCLTN